jgi:hypothetical protein
MARHSAHFAIAALRSLGSPSSRLSWKWSADVRNFPGGEVLRLGVGDRLRRGRGLLEEGGVEKPLRLVERRGLQLGFNAEARRSMR